MITGDHQETAMAIGQMLGIGNSQAAITGYQLEHMSDAELADAAKPMIFLPAPARNTNCVW